VDQQADRVDLAAEVVGFSPGDLRSHVPGRAHLGRHFEQGVLFWGCRCCCFGRRIDVVRSLAAGPLPAGLFGSSAMVAAMLVTRHCMGRSRGRHAPHIAGAVIVPCRRLEALHASV